MHICRDSDNKVCKVDEPDIVWFLGPYLYGRKRSGSGSSVYLQKKEVDMLWSEKESQYVTL